MPDNDRLIAAIVEALNIAAPSFLRVLVVMCVPMPATRPVRCVDCNRDVHAAGSLERVGDQRLRQHRSYVKSRNRRATACQVLACPDLQEAHCCHRDLLTRNVPRDRPPRKIQHASKNPQNAPPRSSSGTINPATSPALRCKCCSAVTSFVNVSWFIGVLPPTAPAQRPGSQGRWIATAALPPVSLQSVLSVTCAWSA